MRKFITNNSFGTKTIVLLVTAVYLLIVSLFVGLKPEHWVIAGLYNICIWINTGTRKFILAFSAFIVFALIYQLMKAFPNYLFNLVDVAPLYNFEKTLFGINVSGQIVTLNEFFAQHHNTFIDLLCGAFYINWIPVPIAFGVWLYYKNKKQFLDFSLSFLLVNLIGFCIYYLHPAAPPWYVAKYGFDLHLGTPGETAGLSRVDEFLGINIFGLIYSRNSNVFAALPSLHCAYPVVVLFYALKNNTLIMRFLFAIFMIGIWFSALYSGHHYLTDVFLGLLCAVIGLVIFQYILLKRDWFQLFLNKYLQLIN
jgi:hypothetical protein